MNAANASTSSGAVHPPEELAAGLAVAVLPGQRAPERDDEIRRALDVVAERGPPGYRSELEVVASMDAPLAEVAAPGPRVAVLVPQPGDRPEVLAEAGRRDRGVLPPLVVRRPVRAEGHRRKARLPDPPDALLEGSLVIADPVHVGRDGCDEPGRQRIGVVVRGPRPAPRAASRARPAAATGARC